MLPSRDYFKRSTNLRVPFKLCHWVNSKELKNNKLISGSENAFISRVHHRNWSEFVSQIKSNLVMIKWRWKTSTSCNKWSYGIDFERDVFFTAWDWSGLKTAFSQRVSVLFKWMIFFNSCLGVAAVLRRWTNVLVTRFYFRSTSIKCNNRKKWNDNLATE